MLSIHRGRRAHAAWLVGTAVAAVLGVTAPAQASGPYVFCNKSFTSFETCVDSNGHTFAEVDAVDLNGSNRVCATQKSGPNDSSPNQYNYACANGSAGVVNYLGLFGYAAAHNGESFSQIMEGQFYL